MRKQASSLFTLISFILFTFFSKSINANLTIERVDAIADLCSIATRYFADSPQDLFDAPGVAAMNAFARTISEMWDENESSLYVLTRLAKLVDERDENGDLSVAARVIRAYEQQSNARQIYETIFASSDNKEEGLEGLNFGLGNSNRRNDTEIDDELEKMYTEGNSVEADYKLSKLIQSRWTSIQRAINDIEISARKGNFHVLSGLIKVGSDHPSLKSIAPEIKAGIATKFLSLKRLQLDQISAKWLLTMDTFREDQLKLVKIIEKAMKRRGQMSLNFIGNNLQNNLLQLIGEVINVSRENSKNEFSISYFDEIDSVDEEDLALAPENRSINNQDALYKTMIDTKSNNQRVFYKNIDAKSNNNRYSLYKTVDKNSNYNRYSLHKMVDKKSKNNQDSLNRKTKSKDKRAPYLKSVTFIERAKEVDELESKPFYEKVLNTREGKSTKNLENSDNANIKPETKVNTQNTVNDTPILTKIEPNSNPQPSSINSQTSGNTHENDSSPKNYFEEKEKTEEEIDKLIYENNKDPLYDDDGVYDAQEQNRDETAWIVIAILMGLIIGTALGSYIYLRIRRARRNRTMLVVNGALEGTSILTA